MRYSMLAHLVKMTRTLQEAAAYVDAAPDGDPLCPELLSNGVKMLGQIRSVMGQHRDELYDPAVLEHLAAAEALWEEGGDALQGALEAFAQALPKSVRYQVRAVFFTGLGSTWDAMQSVYVYMRDDPRFDPVVVLIPVVRQIERDGKIIQDVTYEDYLTPMGIPFLEYSRYSLKDDCPDLAFTNQPYEGATITEFWPNTIAQSTRLVYLPYYLPDMVDKNTRSVLDAADINRYAWKIVFPTQKQYRFHCRHAANGGANGLLTGIPKLDHFVTLPKRGAALPAGWECLEGKRVFLWNTWYIIPVSALRWFDEVISWFETHEDCALIWRPHPMTDTVTRLYHPKEYPGYLEHIRRVDSMPNAVRDCDASCEAAFYYSHAMVSDYSSMQPQYLLMDKPALWVRNDKYWRFTGEEFIESSWMEQTETPDGILAFLEQVRCGEDNKAQLRKEIRARDLPLADGRCGERVCEALWEALHEEDFPQAWSDGSSV